MAAKSLVTFWSKAALDEAGESVVHIQRTIQLECSEIVEEAKEWFMHVVQAEGGAAYLCNGRAGKEKWQVLVQLAQYEPMDPLPDDHPDPASRGRVIKMPRPVESADNETFAEVGHLEH
jgi:hypothetical protein